MNDNVLRTIFDGLGHHVLLLAPDGAVLEANRASLEFAGHNGENVAGRPFWDSLCFALTPGAPDAARNAVDRAAAGEFIRYEASLRKTSAELAVFNISLRPLRNDSGDVAFILVEGVEITGRKAEEGRHSFLVRLDEAMHPLSDPNEIAQTAVGALGDYLMPNRCSYLELKQDEDTFTLIGDHSRESPGLPSRYTFAQFGEECLREMREGRPYVVEEVETDARSAAVREIYRLNSIQSVLFVPAQESGSLVAVIAVYDTVPRRWRSDEVELVQLVANRCWEAIECARVARELAGSERRLCEAVLGSPHPLMLHAEDGEVLALSRSWTALTGYKAEEIPTYRDWCKVAFDEFASSQAAHIGSRAVHAKNGDWRIWDFQVVPLSPLPGGRRVQITAAVDVTELVRAEAELKRQWQTFDTALSHIPDFIYTFDLEGRITYANDALLKLWQRPMAEVLGASLRDLNYPKDFADRLQRQIGEVAGRKQPLRDQVALILPSGETREYEYDCAPVIAANGQVTGVAGSARDITERKQAEYLLEQDRLRWRDLLLHAPAAIALLRGPEHRFEWVNEAYARLVDLPSGALFGKSVKEALSGAELDAYLVMLDRVYRTGEPVIAHEAQVRFNRGDGSFRDVYLNFVYMATRDAGNRIDGIFVHATEVTDMVRARHRIEESEQQFRTLAESIPHLAWMADETGYRFWFNRRWYDYTGTTLEQMQGLGWQTVHDPAELPRILEEWRSAIASGEPFEMIYPMKGADGAYCSFLTRAEPVRDADSRVVRWFGTNTDITGQRRTEEALRRMNRELEEFAYVASHDLQEPLRMVNIYTQLILKRLGGEDTELNVYSGFVRQGVIRMGTLIGDLLKFSSTVHEDELPMENANLSAALAEAISVLKNRIEESGAVITAQPLPTVLGDSAQLAHVFQNLLSNALKYRQTERTLQIDVSVEGSDEDWVVSVRDNGIGFAPQYAERIFGLFKRLHKSDYPGTGLGLALCKRIIERYGGIMWADGRPGEGATFYFSLPKLKAGETA